LKKQEIKRMPLIKMLKISSELTLMLFPILLHPTLMDSSTLCPLSIKLTPLKLIF
jgi:hypothetical protein